MYAANGSPILEQFSSLMYYTLLCVIIGDKFFTAAGPTIWNNLPQRIREFNSIILFKTHLETNLYHLN